MLIRACLTQGQMLRQTKSITTILDDPSSGICAAKATVLAQLNGLSTQLLAEIGGLNATDAAKLKAYQDANQASLSMKPLLMTSRAPPPLPPPTSPCNLLGGSSSLARAGPGLFHLQVG